MKPRRPLLSALLTLAVLLGGGCGFHLRGTDAMPAEASPLYIQSADSPLHEDLRRLLRASGIELADTPAAARIVLRILDERWNTRTVSVDSRGKVLESELHYRVGFDAVGQDGKARVQRQTVDLVRNVLNPDVEVLGKRQEEAMLRADMQLDMASRILYRLRAQLR